MGELISFRISDAEAKALNEIREMTESLNLAAQRLFREKLKSLTEVSELSTFVDNAVDTTVDKIVDKVLNSNQFEGVLEEKLSWLVSSLNQKLVEHEERIELLGKN